MPFFCLNTVLLEATEKNLGPCSRSGPCYQHLGSSNEVWTKDLGGHIPPDTSALNSHTLVLRRARVHSTHKHICMQPVWTLPFTAVCSIICKRVAVARCSASCVNWASWLCCERAEFAVPSCSLFLECQCGELPGLDVEDQPEPTPAWITPTFTSLRTFSSCTQT